MVAGSDLGEYAADLAAREVAGFDDQQIVRPLYPNLHSEAPERLGDAHGGSLDNARSEMVRQVRPEDDREPEPAGRRAPVAPEPAPAALLHLGYHERPVRSSIRGPRKLASTLLSRADLLVEIHLSRQRAVYALYRLPAQPVHNLLILVYRSWTRQGRSLRRERSPDAEVANRVRLLPPRPACE